MVRKTNLEDTEKLIESNKYLIINIVNSMCVNESNRQDLMQAGYMGLIRAKETYNKKFKTCFSTWAYWQIKWEVQKAQNATYLTSCSPRTRPKRKEYYVPIDNIEDKEDTSNSAFENLCYKEDEEDQQKMRLRIFKELNHKLSPAEREVFIEYFIKSSKSRDILSKYPTFYGTLSRVTAKLAIIIESLGIV